MAAPTPPAGPLKGITVIDLTRVLAGPYCTMVLSDLGARVIKVEVPGTGDDSRHIGPFIKGTSAYFTSINRGKESIALDLKDDADRAIFEDLLDTADVLVENYRAGTLAKLGYGWDKVHERWPRLIYAAASGFGQDGPYAKLAAYDMVVQGMGGIMSITGHPGGPPTRVGTSIGDITAGLFTAVGINAALYHRTLTGEGQMIDVAMLDCQIAILENAIARYYATGQAPGPLGARHPSITPFEALRAKDGWLIVAAGNDGLFTKLCQTIGAPEMADEECFASNDLRTQNHEALKAALEKALAKQGATEWLEALQKAGVPCAPLNNVEQALHDPQIAHRNMVVELEDPKTPGLRVAGNPIKMSGFPDTNRRAAAPVLDADRAHILSALGRKA